MQYLRPATIRYTPLDDLETKISAQIKQAILDNVTLHQQYKYQTGKRGTETSIKINNKALQITIQERNHTNDTTKKAQIVKGSHGHSSVLKLITVTI
jgi:1,2-phenylacetyl-CoA epoxidase catalytic subunit